MGADVRPGPSEHRLKVGSLDRQIGGHRGAIERDDTEPDACEYPFPGWASAVHSGDISSASIPAVCFVITAIMPARCHQRNETKSSIPVTAGFSVESQIKERRVSFPSIIATHSQLQP